MLAFAGPASTDDTKRVIVAGRPHDKDETPRDRPDGDETILRLGVGLVEDLEVVGARSEKLLSLLEGDAMLPPVREVLGFIPGDPHPSSVGYGLRYVNGLALPDSSLPFHSPETGAEAVVHSGDARRKTRSP